ncbi:MAG: 23S rRNA (adenine(2503)-C(2))-methyltransferase RlmN [Nitrospirae bacterium]|nr:23S rRNA (adenine(2503)-C(2))-methyltransferase RlmN [Nitrospirota bacterium]
MINMKTNLKSLSEKDMAVFIESLGQKPYRTRQIINWIYLKLAASFDEMTNLPLSLREVFNKTAYISSIILLKRQISRDGTQKFLFELEDGETIESVLIPDNDKRRLTLCISSQVGCAMRCGFCVTGKLGFKRNLKAYEIVDQVIAVQRLLRNERGIGFVANIVFMGMGEPLNNFEEVVNALWRLTGIMSFSKSKITVSTAGIVPGISELAKKGPGINLAVSLNASTDEIRNKIMPINKKYPLKALLNACKNFPLPIRRRITFEYVLLDGINDSVQDALRLIKLLKGIRAKVNLIPYNPIYNPPSPPFTKRGMFKRPEDAKILAFQKILINAGITAIIRKSKGEDIKAACGQLRAGYNIAHSS